MLFIFGICQVFLCLSIGGLLGFLCWSDWGSAGSLCAGQDVGQPGVSVPSQVLGLPGVFVLVKLGFFLGSLCFPGLRTAGGN